MSAKDQLVRLLRGAYLSLPMRTRRQVFVLAVRHRLPNLRHPQRFTDKVHWRILNDRRAMFARTCDKLGMKEIARERAGDSMRIPETYWAGTDLRELASVDLPDLWVLKPTHRSGQIIFGNGKPDIEDLQARTDGWLEEIKWAQTGEWAYGLAVPQFLVEERIGGRDAPITDVKFFVFDGVPRGVAVVADRFGGGKPIFYDTEWNRVAVEPGNENAPNHPPPANLAQMLEVAGRIGADFDMLRVDLYDVDGETWFGETTPYPNSGMGVFAPDSYDFELGSYWTLPDLAETSAVA